MFNPFKKKDNEFKLDDYELPSLNSQPQNTSLQPSSNIENPFESNSTTQTDNYDFSNNQTSTSSPLSQLSQENRFSQPNNFDNPFANPQQNNQSSSQQIEKNNTNNTLNNDITKAKLDTMDSKITLIDAKLASIDQKLEILTKLIHEEVSEETKRKLSVQNMMKNIKQ